MVSNLVTENALVFFYNMDKFKSEGYDHMREKTLEYIIANLDEVMESDYWSDFTKNCPNLVKEIMKMLAQEKHKVEIRLQDFTGFEFTHLSVKPSDTVAKIKAIFQESLKTDPANLRLIFNKTKLKENKTLADYKILNKSTIQYATSVTDYNHLCPDDKEDHERDEDLPTCSIVQFSKDLGKLMDEGRESDVTLTCHGEGFPCHKAILTARSPAIAAKLHSLGQNMEVKDVTPGGLKNMLRFIYTGRLPDDYHYFDVSSELLEVSVQFGLLYVAEKMLEEMSSCFSTDKGNPLDILVCVDMYRIGDRYQTRRERVMNYIVENIEIMMKSCGWNDFVKKNGEAVTDIMKALISSKNEKMSVVQNKCECKLKIFVKTLTGQKLELLANPMFKIQQVKWMVQYCSGTPPDMQNLIFQSKLLEDEKTLADYKLGNESTIYMTLRLGVGGRK